MEEARNRTVAVFGLGYVGCVSVACLADAGHRVVGVDVQDQKVTLLEKGLSTIVEPGLDDLLARGHARGTIAATMDVRRAVEECEIALVAVGTPSGPGGELDLTYILAVAEDLGRALREVAGYRVIAIRSTVKPGTAAAVARVIERLSGRRAGADFGVVANPEFLREGTAIKDYLGPPYVLIGGTDARAIDEVASIYGNVSADILRVRLETAETIKYVNNSWHALKVAFANEVAAVCAGAGVDPVEVSDVFLRDRVLNVSPAYLRPGFAYGGACLPKDLAGLVALARSAGVEVPVLRSIEASNDRHIDRAIARVTAHGINRIGVLGLSFKSGTDDIRNSPALRLVQALTAQGFTVRVLDESVRFLLASGRAVESYRDAVGPVAHLLVAASADLIRHAELLVIAKQDPAFDTVREIWGSRPLVDLASAGPAAAGAVAGAAW